MQTECQIILINFLLLFFHKLAGIAKRCPITIFPPPVFNPRSLPDCYPITPRSAQSIMSEFFLDLEATNLKPPSKIAFPAPIPYSINEPSRIFLTEDLSGLTLIPNPPNVLTPLRSTEIPPRPHTTSQRENGTNYQFFMGILSEG